MSDLITKKRTRAAIVALILVIVLTGSAIVVNAWWGSPDPEPDPVGTKTRSFTTGRRVELKDTNSPWWCYGGCEYDGNGYEYARIIVKYYDTTYVLNARRGDDFYVFTERYTVISFSSDTIKVSWVE